jgi:Flavin containing amine oxidoreductase
MSNPAEYDIAIVGGGIGGIYTAWRLMTSPLDGKAASWAGPGKKLKVGLFEGSGRIGGRLLSAIPPGMPDTVCEIGGMRYVSSQTLVRSLVENKLKLPSHPQVVDRPENIAYLRGQLLRFSQVTDPDLLPYDLQWIEAEWVRQKNDPSGLMGWAITRIFPQVGSLSGDALQQFLRTAEIDGIPLYQHGFWNLIARATSFEAYQLSKALVGYDCLGNNANAVDLTSCYFDFTPDVKYFLLDGSYEAVPWTLEQEYVAAGGELFLNSSLSSFDRVALSDGSDGVELRFSDGREPVRARALVLAMPRRSLEKLTPTGPVLDPARAPHVQKMLGSVMPIALYKIFVAYNYPWWESAGVTEGRSFTDLPVRQCYYWAKNANPSPDPKSSNAILMVYNDATNVDFWGGLRMTASKPKNGLPDHPAPVMFARQTTVSQSAQLAENPFAARLRKNWVDHAAPKLLVEETHRQLMQMHNVQYAPAPVEAAYADWSDDPYGGAVHLWNRNYKSWVLVDKMTQPVEDFRCYICGEAYSTKQTWAEGALETAEIVLHKLGLAPPDWITPSTK